LGLKNTENFRESGDKEVLKSLESVQDRHMVTMDDKQDFTICSLSNIAIWPINLNCLSRSFRVREVLICKKSNDTTYNVAYNMGVSCMFPIAKVSEW